MLEISEDKIKEIIESNYKVYSSEPLTEGCECFGSSSSLKSNDTLYITSVSPKNIKHVDGRFFYTLEDLSASADWFPAQVIPIGSTFVKCKSKKQKCVSTVDDDCGKVIKSNYSIMNMCTPAFCTNEDLSINEYRFYLTLFNDYTVKQCQYERHNLHDASFTSSKYSLPLKLQNSNFLQSKDFKVINVRRKEEESVPVGLIIKEDDNKYAIEYGKVYINMDNKISIIWH